jgi:hypothetical protein
MAHGFSFCLSPLALSLHLPMAKFETPAELGSLLSSILTQKHWQQRLQIHQVFVFWDELVGPEIARQAQPQVIRGDVLWVAVSSSIWMQQLQYERYHLLELINARLGVADHKAGRGDREATSLALSDLKFQLDPGLGRIAASEAETPVAGTTVDHEQFAEFSASLNSIPDQEIRESMKRLWLVQHRLPRG